MFECVPFHERASKEPLKIRLHLENHWQCRAPVFLLTLKHEILVYEIHGDW